MTGTPRATLAAVGVFFLTTAFGCSSDDTGEIPCSYANHAVLATSSWPKFRRDLANTGNLTGVDLRASNYAVRWIFPPPNEAAKGSFAASPVLNTSESTVFVGSSDANLYAIDSASGALSAIPVQALGPITASAMAADRFGVDALFVGAGDGNLYATDGNGVSQPQIWPVSYGGFILASPTTNGIDGSIYTVSANGQFIAVCPNGAFRFAGVIPSAQSSLAFGPGNVLYFGADDRLLRSFTWKGVPIWTFAASAPIVASPVVDVTGNTVYAADLDGRVFRVNDTGQLASGFKVLRVGPVSGSPALAGGTLYVPSEDGTLYAVDGGSGTILWQLALGGPILSSPAVATASSGTRVIVAAASAPAGSVFIIADAGTAPEVLAVCSVGDGATCAPPPGPPTSGTVVESSPAIDAEGTIYIGAGNGRVYAIAPTADL
ncbi:PQQ-binding-like beta-propeller repeat protein [Candidatus Binatia bacterium]|nr:PQQ-binding-like beta-propeller repeat protein [Candidatus Binatia bacterium]